MPWTKKQIRYLLSHGSPLSEEQKAKMKRELHRDHSLIRKVRKTMRKRKKHGRKKE